MIRLPLSIVARRLLWLPPLFVVFLMLAMVYSSIGRALPTYALTAIPLAAIGLWLTVIAGSVDDDAHRELIAAQVGSVARVHLARAACGAIGVSLFSVLCTAMPLILGELRYNTAAEFHPLPSSAAILAAGLALHTATGLMGVACGTFLHRPLLQRPPVAVIVGVGLSTVLVFLPPVVAVLRRLNRNDPTTTPWLFVAAVALTVLATTAAGWLASRQ